MRLTETSVVIRPRSAWEAMDLGVRLAQRHLPLLAASWLCVSLPLLLLLSILLWQHPFWAIAIFWWFKPLLDRLPLYILSQSLFAQTPTLKQALKAYPSLLKPQLVASLTWRRLSLVRSFVLPVQQLEGLSAKPRQQRLNALLQRDQSAATWLTVVGMNVELAIWTGLSVLALMMLPHEIELNWNWQSLIADNGSDWLWLDHLSNLGYALVLLIWEPVYVACGFSLYLNRRTVLEAWDIELVFRRLRQRLTGAAYALLVSGALLMTQLPNNALAQTIFGPDEPRLLEQTLNSEAAQKDIKALLSAPPFEHKETITQWRLGDEATEKNTDDSALLQWLKSLSLNGSQWLNTLASVFEVLLWGAAGAALVLALWHYRDWLRAFGSKLARDKRPQGALPEQLFGLALAPQSLPDDVASSAYALWSTDRRAALSLLYRALLSHLLHHEHLALKDAHTEGEVLQLLRHQQSSELVSYSQELTALWQALAYGHQQPDEQLREPLCERWRALMKQASS